MNTLSHRSEHFATKTPSYLAKHFQSFTDHFHAEKNPSGIITCCIAENNLTLDLLLPQLKRIFKLIGETQLPLEGTSNNNNNDPLTVMTGYQDMMGIPIFRDTLATFLSQYIFSRDKLNTNNIIRIKI